MSELSRAKTTITRLREQAQETTRRVVSGSMAVAGGATAGYLDGKGFQLPGTDIPASAALSAAVSLLGLAEMGGKYNDELLAFGFGMAAASAGDAIRSRVAA